LTSTDDARVTKVNEIVRCNRRVREIAEVCDFSVGSCREILTEKLGTHRVATKFVPRLMSQDQKDNRVTICRELLRQTSKHKIQLVRSDRTLKSRFFDSLSVIHHEFLPEGQTELIDGIISSLNVAEKMRRGKGMKRRRKTHMNVKFLHHDNDPSHSSHS